MENKRRIALCITLVFLFCICSVVSLADVAALTDATINLGSYTTHVDSNVTVPIEIINATEIAGGAVNISFNPSIVNVLEVLPGDFGAPIVNINNTPGFVSIAKLTATAVGKENAILANVTFKGISNGVTALNFTSAYLNNETGNLTYPETFDGEISVNVCCVGATQTFTCGDEVTESCTFDGDMSCTEGHGLIIGASGITIDGAGYTLDGVSSGACDGLGIQRSGIYNKAHDDVVIKNLEIKNFCNGIYFRYDEEEGDEVKNVTIDNCDIHHNGGDTGGDNSVHGIKAIGVFDSMIKNCKIHHNTGKGDSCEGGGNGIFLRGISGYGAWDNIITHNEIYDNKKGGFFTKMMCKDTEVSYNKLRGNGQGGIILRCMKSETHDIHHNNASYNYGSGIFIGGPNNTVRYNIASFNKNGSEYGGGGAGPGSGSPGKYGMGICMGRSDGSFNNEIISNVVCGNEGVDIESFSATAGNTGDWNTCNSCYNYNDNGTTCCTYACPGEMDFTIINKSESWVDTQNKTYDVTYTVKNAGNSTAGESTTGIYIDGSLVATVPLVVIGAGESCTRTVGPFTKSEGNDTIRVCADNENVIEESNETNNCLENEFEYPGTSAGFDTGAPANPYPSIFGTHNGTIIPDQDITVNRMYTYPCEGTGGHSEYAIIYNESETIAEAYWNGYISDFHNITFNTTFTLFAGCTYNYTIRTGSYPQIVHAREYKAKEGGNITCTEFVDANGKKYDDWIPAIRLWKE